MTGIIIFFHIIISILLAVIILMQSGRGGGLTESFASAGDILGGQTNTLLSRGTTLLAAIFLITSLSLAFFSSQKEKSLMANKVAAPVSQEASMQETLDKAGQDVEKAMSTTQKTAQEAAESQAVETEAIPQPTGAAE